MIRKRSFFKFFRWATLACIILWLAFHNRQIFNYYKRAVAEYNNRKLNLVSTEEDKIILAHAVCGRKKLRETLAMLKSAIIFQKSSKLHFILFTDTLKSELTKWLDNWRSITNNIFSYEFRLIQYPGDQNFWINMWARCSTLRLFFPSMIPDVKKVLYVDADIIFMNDLSEIWRTFQVMNSTQICGATYEMQEMEYNYYKNFSEIPYYGEAGINSGVLLMDLEKMRHFNWSNKVIDTFTEYKHRLKFHDQDLLNIIFHFHPERLYLLSCVYNVKRYDCERINRMCRDAVSRGISLLHGQGNIYNSPHILENRKHYAYKLVYEAYEKYQLGTDPIENLWKPLKRDLKKLKNEDCTALMHVYLEKTNGISSIP